VLKSGRVQAPASSISAVMRGSQEMQSSDMPLPSRAKDQGLTLVHFSAQPEPFFVTEPLKLPSDHLKRCKS
jgi:hypothetical protein